MDEKVTFTDESGEETGFYVIEETKINNTNYLLVTDDEDGEFCEAYILKEISADGDEEAVYETVDDQTELNVVAKIFSQIVDDIDIEF